MSKGKIHPSHLLCPGFLIIFLFFERFWGSSPWSQGSSWGPLDASGNVASVIKHPIWQSSKSATARTPIVEKNQMLLCVPPGLQVNEVMRADSWVGITSFPIPRPQLQIRLIQNHPYQHVRCGRKLRVQCPMETRKQVLTHQALILQW